MNLFNIAVTGLVFSVLLFAGVYGSRCERIGATVYITGFVATWVAQVTLGATPVLALIVIDAAVCIGFAYLTFRYPAKLWPGIAGCAQLLVVVFSATRMLDFPLSATTFLYALNVASLAVILSLCAGTWAARWLRRAPSDWDIAAQKLSHYGDGQTPQLTLT